MHLNCFCFELKNKKEMNLSCFFLEGDRFLGFLARKQTIVKIALTIVRPIFKMVGFLT